MNKSRDRGFRPRPDVNSLLDNRSARLLNFDTVSCRHEEIKMHVVLEPPSLTRV